MFFPKLRRRAKWVFLFLAIAFAGSFVFFGVGAGGSGIGDYLSDLLNTQAQTEGPNLEDARKAVQEKPNDPQARLDLATAAQRDGETDEAIAALERYRTMRPEDADALRTLAALYARQIGDAQDRATIASNEAAEASLPKTFAPEDSPFLQEILGNEITDSVSAQAEARANAANSEVQSSAILQQNVLADLTELVDDEPLLFLQLAQAAETAQDYPTAVEAYETFLDKAAQQPERRAHRAARGEPQSHRRPRPGRHGRRGRGWFGSRVGRGIERLRYAPATQEKGHMNFDIKTEQAGGDVYVIALTGEIDLYTAPEFKQQLLDVIDKGGKEVVVDLTDTTFIDSTTLGVLVGGVKRLRPNGGQLSIVCSDRNITKIFEITGLNRVFPIHETRAEALESVGAAGAPRP